ncbi:hypothetical protein R3P38DRAFT_3207640 [Favolaschia claudopus]|uniref:Uncharacterized protein n=1 Tax=Favolaschia claudopus TaxID=2862362 RepID=A0AAW0AKB1_9AGAR
MAEPSDPVFPVELEREIFEHTALMFPHSIPSLLRVARHVYIWCLLSSLLGIIWDRVKEDSSGLLVGWPTLEVLLFQWSMVTTMGMDEYESNKEPRILDVRIVIGVYDDYFNEWEADARGSLSFWAEADSFVLKKRKGEIEGQLAFLSVD